MPFQYGEQKNYSKLFHSETNTLLCTCNCNRMSWNSIDKYFITSLYYLQNSSYLEDDQKQAFLLVLSCLKPLFHSLYDVISRNLLFFIVHQTICLLQQMKSTLKLSEHETIQILVQQCVQGKYLELVEHKIWSSVF